ncbi:MAG: hypothetical protein QOD28_433 [Acidobacteriota bacterium]|jgi:hypothetical protein|nr:hypothetical protein [Acidobacteriota bacterium]
MPVALRSLSRKPKPLPKPESDPRFAKVVEDLKRKASKVKAHPTPAKKAAEAAGAAKGPPNEKAAGAKGKQVDKIKEAKSKKPEPASFLSLLRAEIQKAMPKTLDDTSKFMKGGQAGALKGGLKGNVSQQKQAATGDTAQTSKQPPSQAGIPGKQEQPIPDEAAPPNPDVPAGEAMPTPRPEADVSVQDSKQDTEAAMADAEVTDTQLKKANDPRFSAVLTSKEEVGKQADTAPGQYRTKEKGTLATAIAAAKGASKSGAAAMLGVKGKAKSNVLTRQQVAKAKDEAERKKVADTIEGIYNKTKEAVEAKLGALDEEVNGQFDSGTDAALTAMKSYTEERIDAYKDERYSGVIGKGRWLRDQFKGLPEAANVFYIEGRNLFTRLMDVVIVRVSNLVEKRLAEAKKLVADGQQQIKTYVDSLPKNLKSVGQAAQKEVAGRFAELERGIEDKKNQLASSLAQKYKEAGEKADKALKEIQDSNKGLVQKFVEKLGEIIKIIMEFKGKLMAILRKGWDVIKGILADPIGFLGNLIAALKQGFNQFKENIGKWLLKGIIGWLFGALAEAGVTPPPDFSLPSILKLVLQILGITYERMRAKAVKLLGPTAVTIIEYLIKYVQTLVTGGPAALWEQVKADLANLKEQVLGEIRTMIITEVIKAAVMKLVSMFNPVGAFVQAVLAIYNTVMFVVEQASRIASFISAVVDSVSAIASGAIGAAANKIEQSFGAAIPIVIGFLARLVGVGGLPKKATAVVKKVQGAIDGAIDKFLGKAIAFVKKLFGKGGKEGKKKEEKEKGEKWAKGEAAVNAFLQQQAAKEEYFVEDYTSGLAQIKTKYGFTLLQMTAKGDAVEAAMSPKKKIKNDWPLVKKLNLKPPSGHQLLLDFSNRGNKRVFATKGGLKKFVYNKRTSQWQTIKDDKLIQKAEKDLRAELKRKRSEWISLVEAGKAASAQGFDAGGIGQKPTETEERVVVGEVKGGFRKGWQYFLLDKFTAITGGVKKSLLGKNLDTMRDTAQEKGGAKLVKRFDEAIASGNITIVIKLVGKAVVSGTVWPKLEAKVRQHVKAYIKANYDGVDPDEVIKNVRIEWSL